MPFDSGSAGMTEVRGEPVVGREADVVRGRDHHVRPPSRPSDSPSGRPAPWPAHRRAISKHSASNANVVAAVSSRATRTNRTRDHANTAQNTFNPPGSVPQSITSVSPGTHTAGRRCACAARHACFSAATRRRKLRGDPA